MLFGGTTLLAQCALLLKQRGAKVYVVTSPRHAEEKIKGTVLTEILRENDIPFEVSTDAPRDPKVIGRIKAGVLGVSIGAPWIFKKEFIDRFDGRLVNFHGTRLPQDRGGGAFSWIIMRGERTGCALLHLLEPGIDRGDIVLKKEYLFPKDATPRRCLEMSFREHEKLFVQFVRRVEEGKSFKTIKQDESQATYWPRLSTDMHGFVDWNWNAREIVQFVRAFDEPYAGASTFVGEKRARLFGASQEKQGAFHPFQAGIVYRIHGGRIYVAAHGSGISFERVLIEDGSAVALGDRLFTPLSYLEQAREFRAVYTASGIKKNT